jgi:hypothetical protein
MLHCVAGRLLVGAPGGSLNDENGRHRQEQTEKGHRDEQDAQLAVIRWHQEGAGRLVTDLTGDDEDLVQVFGAEGAEGQCQIGEGRHHGEEGGL